MNGMGDQYRITHVGNPKADIFRGQIIRQMPMMGAAMK
jgi:hypothetical protein